MPQAHPLETSPTRGLLSKLQASLTRPFDVAHSCAGNTSDIRDMCSVSGTVSLEKPHVILKIYGTRFSPEPRDLVKSTLSAHLGAVHRPVRRGVRMRVLRRPWTCTFSISQPVLRDRARANKSCEKDLSLLVQEDLIALFNNLKQFHSRILRTWV